MAGSPKERPPKRARKEARKAAIPTRRPGAPIPDRVRPRKFGGDTSLMRYYGYNTNKKTKKGQRRAALKSLVGATLIPSDLNRAYIESFGLPGSTKRARTIIAELNKQISGKSWIKENSKLWVSYSKLISDAEWFKDEFREDLR